MAAPPRKRLAPDLRLLLEEKEVPDDVQDKLAAAGFLTVNRFAILEDDRTKLRAALVRDFGLDPGVDVAHRFSQVTVIEAWETARRAEAEWAAEVDASTRECDPGHLPPSCPGQKPFARVMLPPAPAGQENDPFPHWTPGQGDLWYKDGTAPEKLRSMIMAIPSAGYASNETVGMLPMQYWGPLAYQVRAHAESIARLHRLNPQQPPEPGPSWRSPGSQSEAPVVEHDTGDLEEDPEDTQSKIKGSGRAECREVPFADCLDLLMSAIVACEFSCIM